MKPLHILMALSFSPFFQQGLRFFFVSFPLIFFVPRPRGSWKAIFKFSLFLWVFQLSFITLGLKYGVPAGMFSLLIQTKTIVVIILSTLFYHYRPRSYEIIGVILSLTGVAMIAHSVMGEETSAAYLFIIPAVLSVSYASLAFKNDTNTSNPFSITIWCAFIAMIPMFLMSLAIEGPAQALHSLENFTWRSLFALFYTVICATLVATSFYVFLLKRYGPEQIIPFNLLIPVFGTLTSAWVYKETFTLIQIMAIILILTGLVVNQIRRPFRSFTLFKKVSY